MVLFGLWVPLFGYSQVETAVKGQQPTEPPMSEQVGSPPDTVVKSAAPDTIDYTNPVDSSTPNADEADKEPISGKPAKVVSETPEKNVVVLKTGQDIYNLAPESYYLEDPAGKMKLKDILNPKNRDRFQRETKDIANFGFTSSAYWFKIHLKSEIKRDTHWLLGIEYSLLDYVDVFYFERGKYKHRRGGDRRDFDIREVKNRFPYFKINFSEDEEKTIYIRVRTLGSAEIPIKLMTPLHYSSIDHEMQLGQGIFIGIMCGLAFFYLMISIGSKNIEYFLYACTVLSLVAFKSTMNGFTAEYLWGGSIWLTNAAAVSTTSMVFFFELLYAYYFLDIKKERTWKYLYWAVLVVFGFTSVFAPFLPYKLVKLYTILGFASNLMIGITAVRAYRKGLRSAKYFLWSCGALIIGVFAYALQKLGFLPPYFFITYSVEFCGIIQAFGFAVAQTDKINLINIQIRKVQKQALDAQIETNRVTEMMKSKLEELVAERTKDLWQKTQDIKVMMDSIKQGIAVVDGQLTISGEYSAYLEDIVGKKSLGGFSLMHDVLDTNMNTDSRQQVVAAVDMMIGEDTINFDANEHTLPKKIQAVLHGRKMHLELDWAPIEDQDGYVKELLVSIRDVTELIAIRAEADQKEHELALIGQILKHTSTKFNRFIQSTHHLLDQSAELLNGDAPADSWDEILRDFHTIKGNARTYGFKDIATEVHLFEDLLFSLDPKTLSSENLTAINSKLESVRVNVTEYQRISEEVLGRTDSLVMESTLHDIGVFLSDFINSELYDLYREKESLIQLDMRVRDIVCESFRGIISPLQASLESIAIQLKKKTPKIIMEGDDFSIDANLSEKYEDIFVHLIRNSLDHGFDHEQEGEIYINITESDDYRIIIYQDSGHGLNLVKLKNIARDKLGINADLSDQELAELIFRSQVSSAEKVSDISGRGVGMSAVRSFIEEMGGSIELRLGDSREEGYRFFDFVILIPKSTEMGYKMSG
ncbi:MAG: Hpt domain-containing protein [Pseudobacteriovorax sp.]|nr:Hpt domain-containing protein [Pseudobacteriovorax sp.]